MTDQTTQRQEPKAAPGRPRFRAWLVTDKADGSADWVELTGLWPTRTGKGYSGAIRQPVATTGGRLVILPAAFKPGREG